MNIFDAIGARSRSSVQAQRIEELSFGKTNEEKRELERQLLKPDRIQPYTGTIPGQGPVEQRTLKMIFNSMGEMELFSKHFKVSNYKGANTRDVDILMAFVMALESGVLEFNHEDGNLYFVTDQNEKIMLG